MTEHDKTDDADDAHRDNLGWRYALSLMKDRLAEFSPDEVAKVAEVERIAELGNN